MTDRRLTPSNGRVAHVSLQGQVEAERFVEGDWKQCRQPIADILDTPKGERQNQILFGEDFLVLETAAGFCFGRNARDGYVGYVEEAALGPVSEPTHWVTAPATHLYPRAAVRARAQVSLFLGAQVRVVADRDSFLKLQTGHFVPSAHLKPLKARFSDAAGVADLFLGTPYLWGGNSRWGLDCSGLVQMAMLACGRACPRDTDMQEAHFTRTIAPGAPMARGDLVFWKGHVGIMLDAETLLHANGHHMAVAVEPLATAMTRIAVAGGGPITARKRP
jgi:cell wall-associated NlpC family hydrolase